MQCLRWILDTHQEYFLDEILNKLHILTGKKFIRATVYRQIRRCGYSCKKIFETARQIDWMERCKYKLRILEKCHSPEMLVTINETSKGKGDGVRNRMWCRGGTSPQVFRYFGANDTRYSMLAAADINGFVVEACSLVLREAGASDSDSSHGTIGNERFLVWVKECLVPILGNYEL